MKRYPTTSIHAAALSAALGLGLWGAGAALLERSAAAYDSKCLKGSVECEPGPETARLRWNGESSEHRYLWQQSLAPLGLPSYLTSTVTLRVPTQDVQIGGVITVSPRPFDVASKMIERPYEIADMAQLPDLAYSLWDWVLGNEICPLGPDEDLKDCHSFVTHMGTLNSSHFLPQAGRFYAYYHGLAMERAASCASTRQALVDGAAPASYAAFVEQCDQLAFTFEAIGQHYLQDAWSVGHMWPRWGGPEPKDFGGADWRVRGELVALTAGLIHGSRGVLQHAVNDYEVNVGGVNLSKVDVRDALCAPLNPQDFTCALGPLCRVDFWNSLTPPTFGDARANLDRHLGIGDLFATELVSNATYDFSWGRLKECAQGSVLELAEAAGITLRGDTGQIRPEDVNYNATCFGSRVTNGSLWLGAGVDLIWKKVTIPTTNIPLQLIQLMFDNALQGYIRLDFKPLFASNLDVDPDLIRFVVEKLAESQGKLTISNAMRAEYRSEMSKLADKLEDKARSGISKVDADSALPSFMGLPQNADPRYIHDPPAHYLDPAGPTVVDFKKLPDASNPADRGNSIARAYHRGLAADWCLATTTAQLMDFHDSAKGQAPTSDRCKVCSEFVYRHVRIGTNASNYDKAREPLCTYLGGIDFVYQQQEDPVLTLFNAAQTWCGCGGPGTAPNPTSCEGQFGAKIVDARTKMAIEGAHAQYSAASSSGSLASDNTGSFMSDRVPCDTYSIEISADGYMPAATHVDIDQDGTVTQVVELSALEEMCEDITAEVIGSVLDGATGYPIANAQVELRIGIDPDAAGNAAFSAKTDTNGVYVFSALPGGYYTRTVIANGYHDSAPDHLSVCEDEEATDVNLIPAEEHALTFVLKWSRPNDLDLHLLLPNGEEVSFGGCAGSLDAPPFAHLDIDHQEADGPEVITVNRMKPGTYRLFVHNFSGQNDGGEKFTDSEATVTVIQSSKPQLSYLVPTIGSGNFWDVLEFDNNPPEVTFRTVGVLNDNYANPKDQFDGDCTPDP